MLLKSIPILEKKLVFFLELDALVLCQCELPSRLKQNILIGSVQPRQVLHIRRNRYQKLFSFGLLLLQVADTIL